MSNISGINGAYTDYGKLASGTKLQTAADGAAELAVYRPAAHRSVFLLRAGSYGAVNTELWQHRFSVLLFLMKEEKT